MRVYAVGAPRRLEQTISDGLLSGLRRAEDGSLTMVQTSAPISPGSSGGGLFDAHGRLIGITTSGLKESQNLNFAVPSRLVEALSRRAGRTEWQARVAPAEPPAAVRLADGEIARNKKTLARFTADRSYPDLDPDLHVFVDSRVKEIDDYEEYRRKLAGATAPADARTAFGHSRYGRRRGSVTIADLRLAPEWFGGQLGQPVDARRHEAIVVARRPERPIRLVEPAGDVEHRCRDLAVFPGERRPVPPGIAGRVSLWNAHQERSLGVIEGASRLVSGPPSSLKMLRLEKLTRA